jgi:hypothetical protein
MTPDERKKELEGRRKAHEFCDIDTCYQRLLFDEIDRRDEALIFYSLLEQKRVVDGEVFIELPAMYKGPSKASEILGGE